MAESCLVVELSSLEAPLNSPNVLPTVEAEENFALGTAKLVAAGLLITRSHTVASWAICRVVDLSLRQGHLIRIETLCIDHLLLELLVLTLPKVVPTLRI